MDSKTAQALYPKKRVNRPTQILKNGELSRVMRDGNVIIKTFFPGINEDPCDFETRAMSEVTCLHILRDTGIVPRILEMQRKINKIHVTTEYIEHSTEVPDRTQLFKILKILHDHKIVHGDLYSRNLITRSSDNRLMVIDFEHAMLDNYENFYDVRPKLNACMNFDAFTMFISFSIEDDCDLIDAFNRYKNMLPGKNVTFILKLIGSKKYRNKYVCGFN